MYAVARDNTDVDISNYTMFVTGVCAFKKYSHNFNVLDCNRLKSPGWHSRIASHAASGAGAVAGADANNFSSYYVCCRDVCVYEIFTCVQCFTL